MMPEIVGLEKSGGPLTKRIHLDADGRLKSDGSGCLMARGVAFRMPVDSVSQLGTLIGGLRSDQAIALGTLRAGLPRKVDIVPKRALKGGMHPGVIARTAENIVFRPGAHGFALLDFDAKGMPPSVAERLDQAGGFWPALLAVLPGLNNIARVRRASTSAGLFRRDTGEPVSGSIGLHLYLAVQDGADSARFLKALHERCWLAGLGWLMVGAGGQLLERSIIDRMVGAPERLVFEGAPILIEPLTQSAEARRPDIVEGAWLDTRSECPPLTVLEKAGLQELRSKAAHQLADEAAKARDGFIAERADEMAKRTSMSRHAARDAIANQRGGVLLPSVVLPFDDEDLAGKTVADVLADPAAFEGETLADPLEGADYGTCKARIMRRADGIPWIHSFAHGRTVYELKLDARAIRAAMEAADQAEVVATFIRLALQAELNEVEEEALIKFAKEKTGEGMRAINKMLRKARMAASAARAREERERRLAERDDPRPALRAPAHDAPWLPEMQTFNDVLGKSKARIPPIRNIDGETARIQQIKIVATHAFISANEEADTSLPAPPQWVIKVMSEYETAEMLERHIDFLDGEGQSVHCPTPFVRHYMKRDDGALPIIVAISMLPIVLADGHLLVTDGLDRTRGIVFNVEPLLMEILPDRKACNRQAVGKAMTFLLDEWLADVASDHAGKCCLIALALTLIERSLLDQRPAWFVTAGRRGSGKTTTLRMVIEAVTGVEPSASAWSPNEEERRKALLAYLMYGVPYILWDNIARGAQISCPHIEKSCTAAFYADRKLGVSEMVATAAATVHCFTGNNIAPKGDLASRSLQVRLDVDRIDPENRAFRHPDPIGWTRANRAKILRALYVILLGNPKLALPSDALMKTRFKMWYRLVGAAVEHAADCAAWIDPDRDHISDQMLDFGSMFLEQEADDEDATSLAEMLCALETAMADRDAAVGRSRQTFKAADVAEVINANSITANALVVRGFLFPNQPSNTPVTPKAIGKRLKAHVGEPVRYGRTTIVLKSFMDKHDEVLKFYVATIK